ncbi:MAG: dipeptidase [Bacteroidetes bacterium]|nr:dipeptidase [Bacteroidota bacterium]
MQKVHAYIEANKERFLEELFELIRIPSISAVPEAKGDINKAANWLAEKLTAAGAEAVEVCETAGNPIVYGEKIIDPALPTVLVYGHYDVQPADPVEEWHTEPFEPTIKKTKQHPDGAIYARGACDDKGQLYMHMKAFEAMHATGSQACNMKFMLEGEEEVGSEHLGIFCKENTEKLSCDVVLISDTTILANDTPSIETGLRGMSYVEVEVSGPNRDLHSGVYGGAVANPVNVLCKMVASLHDEDQHITVEGFYDDVLVVSAEEREEMNKAPFDLKEYQEDLGIAEVQGEKGYTTVERTGIRPTLDVNGIWGGYIEKGTKTVLPSKAFAKISMRLVPNQNSEKITALFTKHFEALAPASVKVKVSYHHGGEPVVTATDSMEYQAAHKAMEQAFGKAPIPTRGGGSIPIVAMFEEVLGVNTVLMGFGLDSDAIHSPNEHYGLFNFYKGIETIPYFHQYYLEMKMGV